MTEPSRDIPLILLSGMGADERLFGPQFEVFPQLHVPKWIEPIPRESLRDYAKRLAASVDPGGPCLIGGASFGGIVAMEMAPHLETPACILIGSVRSHKELPLRWRILKPVAWLGPDGFGRLAGFLARYGKPFLGRATIHRLRKLSLPEAAFLRWSMCAAVRWRKSPAAGKLRLLQIHGTSDRVLPASLTTPDVLVPGGQHALSLFNASAVNAFLANCIAARPKGK